MICTFEINRFDFGEEFTTARVIVESVSGCSSISVFSTGLVHSTNPVWKQIHCGCSGFSVSRDHPNCQDWHDLMRTLPVSQAYVKRIFSDELWSTLFDV